MSKSIRIRTTPLGDDKHLKVKIDQDFDFLEILSLKISQTEAYKKYCSDYGAVVGRVVVNNGFGVENAKVSIFIPLSEEDKNNSLIAGLYPYESVYSKDSKGIRYNLLSNQPRPDDECHVAVGTFPTKREVLDCDTTLEVFEKYYKFTTTTNKSGDFMIFGVPVGEHTIHVDVDLSDIGFVSQKPYELISQGYNKNLFSSPSQFKTSSNLDVLTQIKSRNSSVSVIPFWGDLDECEIGITRIDFDLNYSITPTAIFIGSIFGDNEKNSVNKRCNPRRKMGLLCDTVTGEGTIEIIRKTQDNLIETLSIDGDRLINENGVWCFQIPMNLDRVVTDEFGNLIPSEDPEIGIPTNAKVRFRIAMDDTGEEGRLRSRAKFLVPNRTNDYNFDDSTPNTEFADLRWKKVYTVKQFIARYQKYCGTSICGTRRGFIGIKDVDDCGDHTPFPYNRVDTDLNPLFTIICLIVTILMTLIELINLVIISLINIIIGILNYVLCIICKIIFAIAEFVDSLVSAVNNIPGVNISFNKCDWCIGTGCCGCGNIMNYLPCISIKCDEESYAPGCYKPASCNINKSTCNIPTDVQALGWCAADSGQPPKYYPGDGVCNQLGCGSYSPGDCHGCCGPVPVGFIPFAGVMDCIQIQLARSLNVFKFDFYNDWINGSLYSFLYKYKVKRKKNRKRTLEKFCDFDCHDDFESDSEQPEHKSNKCRNSLHLVDTCINGNNVPTISFSSVGVKEGVVKEYKDELYYAAYTHDKTNILYATDITCLGSAVNCDIDGQQKIVQQLLPTTYKIPPDTNELDDNNQLETTAIDPLLLEINCFRVKISNDNCKNIKRICEIGIGLDEDRTDDLPTPGVGPNCLINIFDTQEELDSKFLRDELGKCATGIFNYNSSVLTDYNTFRGFNVPNPLNLPTKNSYFYYFGILPGKSAIECANSNYFVPCKIDKKNLIPALITTIDNSCAGQNLGSANVSLLGGQQPFNYTFVDINGNSILGTPSSPTSNNTLLFSNLFAGSYQLSVTDNGGDNSLYNINISGPLPLNAVVNNISNTTSPTNSNGAIDINVTGGVPPYTYTWSNGATSQDIIGVSTGTYSVTINDSGSLNGCPTQTKTLTGLTITSPPSLTFTYQTLNRNGYNISCYGGSDGQIVLSNISGGTGPYTIYSNGILQTSSTIVASGAGTYNITVYDSTSAQSYTQIINITQPPQLTATYIPNPASVLCNGCVRQITINASGGVGPYTYLWNYNGYTSNVVNLPAGTYTCTIKDANNCSKQIQVVVNTPQVLEINNILVTNALCYNGSGQAQFNIAGGTAPYNYKIFESGGSTSYTPNCNNCTTPTNNVACTSNCVSNPGATVVNLSGVPAGVKTFTAPNVVLNKQYYVQVTDANGCKTCNTFTITSPQQLTGLYSSSLTSTIPFNEYTVQVLANGGTLTYANINLYKGGSCIGGGGSLQTPGTISPTSKIYNNLTAGSYYYQIIDSNNCVYCNSFTLI